jgi:hypothetical protein
MWMRKQTIIPRTLLFLGLALCWSSYGQTYPITINIHSTTAHFEKGLPFEWPGKVGSRISERISLAQVTDLMKTIFPESSPPPVSYVEVFKFVQIGDDVTALVAAVDFTGRGPVNALEVVYCRERTCRSFQLDSDQPNFLGSNQLGDLTGEGKVELLTQECFTFIFSGILFNEANHAHCGLAVSFPNRSCDSNLICH